MSTPVDRSEAKLTILAVIYGRYPYYLSNGVGFASRGRLPELVYDTLDEAIAAEAKRIRTMIVTYQGDAQSLQNEVYARFTHLGILEI